MDDSDSDGAETRFGLGNRGLSALGAAYVVVGVGLFYSLATNSIRLFTAVLLGVLGLIGLSLALIVRHEGLVTAENKLIAAFVLAAMGLLFGLTAFTDLSSELVFGVVFVVGVLVPHLLVSETDAAAAE